MLLTESAKILSDEIGLLKALGASARAIRLAFLTEAALLSLAGALCGFGLGPAGAVT